MGQQLRQPGLKCPRCRPEGGEGVVTAVRSVLTGPHPEQHHHQEQRKACGCAGGTRWCERGCERAASVLVAGVALCGLCVGKAEQLVALEEAREAVRRQGLARRWAAVEDSLREAATCTERVQRVVDDARDAARTSSTPRGEAALPSIEAAVRAYLSALVLVEHALPSRCERCGRHGGAPAGSHGRCTVCVRWCSGGCRTELLPGQDWCPRCARAHGVSLQVVQGGAAA